MTIYNSREILIRTRAPGIKEAGASGRSMPASKLPGRSLRERDGDTKGEPADKGIRRKWRKEREGKKHKQGQEGKTMGRVGRLPSSPHHPQHHSTPLYSTCTHDTTAFS
jgi:hypothetical protein